MAIKPGDRTNFETLLRAAHNGDLALMECKDTATGEYRAVICAYYKDPKSNDYIFSPFGHLATDNPYEQYTPPEPDVTVVDRAVKPEQQFMWQNAALDSRFLDGRFGRCYVRRESKRSRVWRAYLNGVKTKLSADTCDAVCRMVERSILDNGLIQF